MSSLLYLFAIMFVIIWILGFFVFEAGVSIHILPWVAILSISVRMAHGAKSVRVQKLN